MKKTKEPKTTVTIRLNDQQHALLQRVCRLKNQSQAGYLAHLATEQAKKDLLDYAVKQYVAGKASLSELVTKTGLDITTLMEAIAEVSATDRAARLGLFTAVPIKWDLDSNWQTFERMLLAHANEGVDLIRLGYCSQFCWMLPKGVVPSGPIWQIFHDLAIAAPLLSSNRGRLCRYLGSGPYVWQKSQ